MGGGAMIRGMACLMGAATAGTAAMAPSSSTAFCHASSQDHSNNMSSALNLSQKEASYGSTPSKATADLRLLNAEDLEYSSDEDWGKLSYNRLIFAPAPSEEEVEEATKELHAALHLERPMFGHSRKRHCLKPPIGGLPNIPTTLTKRRCDCYDLYDKCVPYMDAWTWQKSMVKNNIATIQEGNNVNDAVIILQHSPVYTMGTRSSDEYLFFDKEQPPCDFYRTERGGEVTYHGPGQLVMYPILNLRHYQMDLHWYLRSLEEVVIRALRSACAMEASRIEGITGVWVGDEKVAAIGVRVSRWVTYHGLALNVTTDLSPFKRIVPCGISTRPVGSVCEILRRQAPSQTCQDQSNMLFNRTEELLDLLHKTLLHEFSEVFGLELSHACQDISISSASSYI